MEELSEYDIESILLSRSGTVFSHHQKIISVCDALYNAVSNSGKKERAKKHDYSEKNEHNAIIIANTKSKKKHSQNEIASLRLQQKVLDKQINDTLEQQKSFKEEIEEGKSQQEKRALEIVDLQQELDESKKKKKHKWESLRRAITAYKSALQISIQVIDSSEACDKIRVIFFKSKQDDDPQYHVDLTCSVDSWRVDLIHPSLKRSDEEQLKHLVNFKKQQEVSDVTAFLCVLRELFNQRSRS